MKVFTVVLALASSVSYGAVERNDKVLSSCPLNCSSSLGLKSLEHGFFAGPNSRKFYDSKSNEVNYSGASVGYKLTFNDYLFINLEHSKGQAYRLKESSSNVNSKDLSALNYQSNKITLFVSSNTRQGWKVFGGLGAFRDKVRDRFFPASGARAEGSHAALGIGYRHSNLEAKFTYNTYRSGSFNTNTFTGHAFASDEYYSDPTLSIERFGKIRSDSSNIQIGYIF